MQLGKPPSSPDCLVEPYDWPLVKNLLMSAQAGTTQQDLAGLNQSNKSMKFMDDQKVR